MDSLLLKDLLTAGLVLVIMALLSATSQFVERVFDRHHYELFRKERNKHVLLPSRRDRGYLARGAGGRSLGRRTTGRGYYDY